LEASEYVKVRKSMSKGGQKSSRYSITQEGKKHFERLVVEELPLNPVLANQLANIKILLLGEVEKPVKSKAIKVLKNYYKGVLADLENFLADNASESLNREYIKHEISAINEKIRFLGYQDLN
jgi:DNA-binding PadR family transcriptional regulator